MERAAALEPETPQSRYEACMRAIRDTFNASIRRPDAGSHAVAARAAGVDELIQALWSELVATEPNLAQGVAVLAVGGYGRRELFPYSDVDLMFLMEAKSSEKAFKEPIRRLNQMLWDAGLRVSPMTRTLAECERFDPENVEFTLALVDARPLVGDDLLAGRLLEKALPKLLAREGPKITARLLEVTRSRHAKYGDTIFHLEPNIKDCPGGLRDAHVCTWLERLTNTAKLAPLPEFAEAREFLLLVRAFLHLRHGRDDNTLDWRAQDEAATASLGTTPTRQGIDAAYWMRFYFRHARSIERRATQAIDDAMPIKSASRVPGLAALRRLTGAPQPAGIELRQGTISFGEQGIDEPDPAHDPESALAIFAAISRLGARLSRDTETRLEQALPLLSAHLEDGPGLWRHLEAILSGPFAGRALRAMHALGILELLLPEFHGIDALVIRDAYHRYTVDEHTFVVLDTLHGLTAQGQSTEGLGPWATRFGSILRDLPHQSLLFLAALLHDTGKGHSTTGHALESERMAKNVLDRLELDPYEGALVLDLIRNHLEMSAALRRDVFDSETVRAFATRVSTPEALRMLTLFTYADIAAVHPDALTPWKAENLWQLHMATANFLDRNVDDERVAASAASELGEKIVRIHTLLPNHRDPEEKRRVDSFLEGFPKRYLQTRSAEQILNHFRMAASLHASAQDENQLDFRYAPGVSEITLVTRDRLMLFAMIAGALAAWGMNIITADAFSNSDSIVVDSFRFTDTFRTLELNESERSRFVQSVRDTLSGAVSVDTLLSSRRRSRRPVPKVLVETRIDFDDLASTHSTLLQVVAQDTPGLLRALSATVAEHDCNIEVALVDTEGEMAIDVFYLTRGGVKLEVPVQKELEVALALAIEQNAV